MMKRQREMKPAAILGAIVLVVGCRNVYDNSVEWGDDTTPVDEESDSFSTDGTDDSEYFLSTDDSDTRETLVCEEGFHEEEGVCISVLAEEQMVSVAKITVDDDYVYWMNWDTVDKLGNPNGDGAVRRILKNGGTVEEVSNNPNGRPEIMLVDETHVYWLNSPNYPAQQWEIWRALKSGGERELLYTGAFRVWAMVASPLRIYFTVQEELLPGVNSTVPTAVMSLPKAGSEEATLFYEEPRSVGGLALSADKKTLIWTGLTPSGDWINGGVTLTQAPLDEVGALKTKVLQTQQVDRGVPMLADEEAVYVLELEQSFVPKLRRYTLDDDDVLGKTLVRQPDTVHPTGFFFALQDDRVYWAQVSTEDPLTSWQGYEVAYSPKQPGDPVRLIDNQDGMVGLAVDQDWIYWVSYHDITSSESARLLKMKRD